MTGVQKGPEAHSDHARPPVGPAGGTIALSGSASVHFAPVGTPAPTAIDVHRLMHSNFTTDGTSSRHECNMAMLVNGATECTVCGRRGF